MILLDTNVLSALRKPGLFPNVAAWFAAQQESDLFLSAITIGEIERGIALQAGKNPGFAKDLRAWLTETEQLFADHILDFTASDARIWGRLSASMGHLSADQLIAASALSRDAVVATRNTKEFAATGAKLINPFEA